jgi:K+-transporting ATPase KdpF subunit
MESLEYIASAAITLAVLFYLLYALIVPERF